MVLKHATREQNDTFARISHLFRNQGIRFTVIGTIALREYGLRRSAEDLDIVVEPYARSISVIEGSHSFVLIDDFDRTGRTSTWKDATTSVSVDFLTGGIRINDCALVGGGYVTDRLPIPQASGFGNIAPLSVLIALKLSLVISSRSVLALGDAGWPPIKKLEQNLSDVRDLISSCRLPRELPMGDPIVQEEYEVVYDASQK